MKVLHGSKPVCAILFKPVKEKYLFNSIGDWFQHEYSNGIADHLLKLKEKITQKGVPEYLKPFPNAFNYAVSTSERPYHSLKYAALKDYYINNLKP